MRWFSSWHLVLYWPDNCFVNENWTSSLLLTKPCHTHTRSSSPISLHIQLHILTKYFTPCLELLFLNYCLCHTQKVCHANRHARFLFSDLHNTNGTTKLTDNLTHLDGCNTVVCSAYCPYISTIFLVCFAVKNSLSVMSFVLLQCCMWCKTVCKTFLQNIRELHCKAISNYCL